MFWGAQHSLPTALHWSLEIKQIYPHWAKIKGIGIAPSKHCGVGYLWQWVVLVFIGVKPVSPFFGKKNTLLSVSSESHQGRIDQKVDLWRGGKVNQCPRFTAFSPRMWSTGLWGLMVLPWVFLRVRSLCYTVCEKYRCIWAGTLAVKTGLYSVHVWFLSWFEII